MKNMTLLSTLHQLTGKVRLSLVSMLASLFLLASCTIEPPLHLADSRNISTEIPVVITELNVVWDIDADWKTRWWYGWDADDVERWGEIKYPEPTYFELRRYYQGEERSNQHKLIESTTLYENTFTRNYEFGFHDLHVWSNIDSPDGLQTVHIDERDMDNIIASTTNSLRSYVAPKGRSNPLKKQPDIFYDGYERNFFISRNFEDYDYFDAERNVWVKHLTMTLDPVVYIYLVQVVIYNNNGRIKGLANDATLTNLSAGVNLNTLRTLADNVDLQFDMRMKNGREARDRKLADILGCKLTTYGLCDMPAWRSSRGANYVGSRTDLNNDVQLDLQFNNNTDSVYVYDVTRQVQEQAHGGIITIEIDADTITIPRPGTTASGTGFRPTVEDYGDSISHEFNM